MKNSKFTICITLLSIMSLNIQSNDVFVDFKPEISEEWDNGWERYRARNRMEAFDFNFSQDDKLKLSDLIHEEKCMKQEDIFCALFKNIKMDTPPQYDDWLTFKENQEIRDNYYSNKKIQTITFKIPIEIPLCTEEFNSFSMLVFENKAKSKGSRGMACYNLNDEKISIYIRPAGRNYITEAFFPHTFDVRNPHGKYCNGVFLRSYNKPNPFSNIKHISDLSKIDAFAFREYMDSYICYEFETMDQAEQAKDILDNEVPDWKFEQSNVGTPSYIEHLYTSHNTNYYDEENRGRDFKTLFTVTQAIYDIWDREITKRGTDSSGNIIQEFSHFEKAKQDLIGNRLIVINTKKNISNDLVGSSVGPEHSLEFSVERSIAKKNFGNYRAYVVVTIPLVQKQYKRTRTERNYFGFFKGLELHLNNKLLSCSYDCGLPAIKEDTVENTIEDKTDLIPLFKVQPVYPRRAQDRGTEGYAIVSFTITEAGTVEDTQALEGYCVHPNTPEIERPCGIFNSSAKRAAAQLKYKPRIVNGKPVSIKDVTHKFTYKLD